MADGNATFTVPNVPSSQALIRVIGNQYNGCDYDDSNQVFTIVSSVSITQPNGGESWQATVGSQGQGDDIIFSNATRILNTARVQKTNNNINYTQTFYPDNPLNKLRVRFDDVIAVSGNIIQVYKGVPGQNGYQLIQQFANVSGVQDFGNAWTSTHESGALTIVTAGGGNKAFTAQLESVGTLTKEITWNIIGTSKRFNIDYSIDEGSTWNPIVINYPNTTGIYNWQVPNAPSTQARVRVTDAGNGNIVDISDNNFNIVEAEAVYIIKYPNGGQQFFPNTI